MADTSRSIYRLAAVCGVLTGLSLVVPRFVPNAEGGFASAATAILVFLGILLGAAVVAIYLLVVTLRAYRELPPGPRLVGIAPAVVLVTALVSLVVWLRF